MAPDLAFKGHWAQPKGKFFMNLKLDVEFHAQGLLESTKGGKHL